MALRREIRLLVLVAVFAPFSGYAEGLINNPAWPIGQINLQDSKDGSQIATADSMPPTKMGLGCTCKEIMNCMCEVDVKSNFMGTPISFNPQVHVEFIDKNVSMKVYITYEDKVLISREFLGEKFIPPLCVPIPQFPAIVFCLEVHNLTSNLKSKSAGLCLEVGVNMAGNVLPFHPTLPVGCFSATLDKELVYTPPEIKIPGFENPNPFHVDKISVPLNPALLWPFGENFNLGENFNFGGQNKNNAFKTSGQLTVGNSQVRQQASN